MWVIFATGKGRWFEEIPDGLLVLEQGSEELFEPVQCRVSFDTRRLDALGHDVRFVLSSGGYQPR